MCALAVKQLEHLEKRNLLQAQLYRQSTRLSSPGVASYFHQTLNHFHTLLGSDRSAIAWGELHRTRSLNKWGQDAAGTRHSPYPTGCQESGTAHPQKSMAALERVYLLSAFVSPAMLPPRLRACHPNPLQTNTAPPNC